MRFGRLATGPVLGLMLLCATPMAAQEQFAARDEPLESRIWLDRGTSPVLRRGDLVRVFYRASRDAYVSIFHIDTNGFARLLHPGSPTDGHLALGGRDYRVLFPESRYWQVEEDEGKGYLFMVASPAPLDFSGFAYSRYGGGWNLAALAQAAYRDPFLMMDDVVATLIPERAGEYALDFVAYDIDRPHDYPRFLCYQCHGFRPMFDWNPYSHWCTDFRVVIHDDPYYYPLYRYSGDRVVHTRPPEPSRPMYEFTERADGEGATPVIRTRSGGGPVLPGRVVRPPTAGVPSVQVEPRADARGPGPVESHPVGTDQAPVGQSTAAADEVRAEGADPVPSREPVSDDVVGAPPAVPLPAISPQPDGSLPDADVGGARLRPGTAAPAARAAEGRDERPVLQRRGEPPPAGSGAPPSARPRTPPGDPPPPPAGRPPSRSAGPAAGSSPDSSPRTPPPPSAQSGPPPRSSGPPPAPARRRPPGGPPVG